jgi:hypothetical protein
VLSLAQGAAAITSRHLKWGPLTEESSHFHADAQWLSCVKPHQDSLLVPVRTPDEDGPGALSNDDHRVSGALLHEPEIVLRVLVVILGFDGIPCRGCSLRQGKVAVASLFPVSRTLPAIVAGIGIEPGPVLTSAAGFVSLGIHGCSPAIRMTASRFSKNG